MAYSYDDMQGDAQPAHMGSQSSTGTQMAGDVIDIRDRLVDKALEQAGNPKSPPRYGGQNVYPIRPENPQGKK